MALIRARHDVFGERLVPESKVRLHSDVWTPVEDDEPPAKVESKRRPRKTVPATGDTETPDAVGAGPTTPPSTED